MDQETRASVEKRNFKLLIELVYFLLNRLRWQPDVPLLDQRVYAFDSSGNSGDGLLDLASNLGVSLVNGLPKFIILGVSRR